MRENERLLVAVGATLAGVAVLLGAFGAHALKTRIGAEQLGWWQTGVQYQMWHALALLALGLSGGPWARLPGWLLAAGATLFSLSLYALALGAPRWIGAVTPIGGLAMICGWVLLAWRAARPEKR
jgi:uncharacterized membrane protein YgdD (TMEM256/DUF423 family)